MNTYFKNLSLVFTFFGSFFLCGMDLALCLPNELIIKCVYLLVDGDKLDNWDSCQLKDEHTQETGEILKKYIQNITKDYIHFMSTCKRMYVLLNTSKQFPNISETMLFFTLDIDSNGNEIKHVGSDFFPKKLKEKDMKIVSVRPKNHGPTIYDNCEFYLYYTSKKLYWFIDYYTSTINENIIEQNELKITTVENILTKHKVNLPFYVFDDLTFLNCYTENSAVTLILGMNVLSIYAKFDKKYTNNELLLSLFRKYNSSRWA